MENAELGLPRLQQLYILEKGRKINLLKLIFLLLNTLKEIYITTNYEYI